MKNDGKEINIEKQQLICKLVMERMHADESVGEVAFNFALGARIYLQWLSITREKIGSFTS